MGTFNHLSTLVFDVVLAPIGHTRPWFDLVAWPLLGGIVALLVIKAVSNQAGITRSKNQIQVHLLEVVLFRDDLRVVLPATVKALAHNVAYLGYNIVPMLVMFVPMTTILVQLVSHYAYAPLPVGTTATLVVKLDPAAGSLPAKDVKIALPEGLALDAPCVHTSDGEVACRLKLQAAGDHVVTIGAGDHIETKLVSVGGAARKVSVLRTKGWEALLYPAEAVPSADSPVERIHIDRVDQPLAFFPDGEGGILGWFFCVSLLAGFVLKDKFGVTL